MCVWEKDLYVYKCQCMDELGLVRICVCTHMSICESLEVVKMYVHALCSVCVVYLCVCGVSSVAGCHKCCSQPQKLVMSCLDFKACVTTVPLKHAEGV